MSGFITENTNKDIRKDTAPVFRYVRIIKKNLTEELNTKT